MDRLSLHLLFILVTFTFGPTEVLADSYGVSYVAKWKGNARAAYSITFDDNGSGDNRSVSASILEEYGVRGTFAVVTYESKVPDIFVDMFHRGHEIASHSVNHPLFRDVSIETATFELSESKRVIESVTGVPCVSYIYPNGYTDQDLRNLAGELYISARGTGKGINTSLGANIVNLKIGIGPPFYCDANTCWTDEEFRQILNTYVEEAIAAGGWGIEMFHNLALSPSEELNSGAYTNESVLRDYLYDITSRHTSSLWIAPQGQVARYYLEREGTTINTRLITDNIILVDLLFDGDKAIFNEPLTVVTTIPEHWPSGALTVMQDGAQLSYTVDLCEVESIAKIIISGDISPNATGTYAKLPDNYNSEPCYKLEDNEYYIWSTGTQYYLTPSLGGSWYDCWYSGGGASPIGTYYVDEPTALGTPTATAVSGDEVPCLLYDALPGVGVVSIVFELIRGDLDGDGDVDAFDFAIFAAHWLERVED